MPSSNPPSLEANPEFSEGASPETVRSGVRSTEKFVRAFVEKMVPVRIEVARTLGKRTASVPTRYPEVVLLDDSDDDLMPSDAILEKLHQCRHPDDFLGVMDAIFLEEDQKKNGGRKRS